MMRIYFLSILTMAYLFGHLSAASMEPASMVTITRSEFVATSFMGWQLKIMQIAVLELKRRQLDVSKYKSLSRKFMKEHNSAPAFAA